MEVIAGNMKNDIQSIEERIKNIAGQKATTEEQIAAVEVRLAAEKAALDKLQKAVGEYDAKHVADLAALATEGAAVTVPATSGVPYVELAYLLRLVRKQEGAIQNVERELAEHKKYLAACKEDNSPNQIKIIRNVASKLGIEI